MGKRGDSSSIASIKHLKAALLAMRDFDQRLRNNRGIAEPELVSKHLILSLGWRSIAVMSRKTIQAAWLLTMHSPDDQFQRNSLKILKRVLRGKKFCSELAYLEDRVCVRSGKHQKFGTQFFFDEKIGRFKPYPIRNRDQLDVNRRSAGLSNFSQYERKMLGQRPCR